MLTGFEKVGRVVYVAGLLLLSLASCSPRPATEEIVLSATATPSATPAPTQSAEPPTVAVATIAIPPSPTSVHTSTPLPPATDVPGENATPPTETPPPPTYTPPPPPPTIEGEHLWLQRPVPATASSWTDKTYPYGSTRGGTLRPHTGVEFVVPTGTPVTAAAAGTVIVAGDDSSIAYGPQPNFYGNLVIVELDNPTGGSPVYTLYGHLSEVDVIVGQQIAAGEVLGLSGATGVADGPHLHFEVRVGTNSYTTTRNPLLWLTPLRETGVVAGRILGSTGELLYEAPVSLVRVDALAPYTATASYAAGEPKSDDLLGENFAVDDVVPGFYQAVVNAGSRRFTTELWVYPGRTNWVEVVVGP